MGDHQDLLKIAPDEVDGLDHALPANRILASKSFIHHQRLQPGTRPLGQDMWDYLMVTATVYFSGAIALLVGGLYWRRASRVGAYLALSMGALAVLGLEPVQEALQLTPEHLGVDFTQSHVVLTTAALALGAMFVGSLLFPDRSLPPTNSSSEGNSRE